MIEITRKQLFKLIYKQAAKPLMKFLIKRMGGDWQAAEEVFSETILAAYKSLHTFEHKSSYFTWVCKIGLHKIADYYQDQINHRSRFIVPTLEQLSQIGDNKLTPEQHLALNELRSAVRECIKLLPEEKRRLLYLRYWKDLTIENIAKIAGLSERSTEGKLYRAKLELKRIVLSKHPELVLDISTN